MFRLNYIAMELANWDFWSIVALLIIILGVCEKNLWLSLGFTIFVFKILGNDWGLGFVVAQAFLLSLSWYQCNQFENAISLFAQEMDGVQQEIQGIRVECQKIRKTFNPEEQYLDELSDRDYE